MFHNVIVGTDGGASGRDALALARRLAAPDAKLTLVHIYAAGIPVVPAVLTWDAVEAERSTALLEDERARTGISADLISIGAMTPGEGLHRVAESRRADLLVVGSSRRGVIGRVVSGDDTGASLNGAPCAVAIAPVGYDTDPTRFVRIGVGYDGSAESALALEAAKELASRDGSEVEALNAVHLAIAVPASAAVWADVQPEVLDQARTAMAGLDDVSGSALFADPRQELVGLSRRVDLLVLGSRGYGPLRRMLLGSTSTYLQRHVRCPLLVVPRGASHRDDLVVSTGDDDATVPAGVGGGA